MALTPQNNEAFFREVDEELRREQMSNIGRRYGLWIIGAIVLSIVSSVINFFTSPLRQRD